MVKDNDVFVRQTFGVNMNIAQLVAFEVFLGGRSVLGA